MTLGSLYEVQTQVNMQPKGSTWGRNISNHASHNSVVFRSSFTHLCLRPPTYTTVVCIMRLSVLLF